MELIVELVTRSKKLLHSHKIQGEQISIGRAFDNDVVLTDPYVCPHHLSVESREDGAWQICDRDSLNGSFSDDHQPIVGCQMVQSGDVVAIGKSHLRFIYPGHPVAPAIRLSGIEGFLNLISSPQILVMVFLLYVGLLLGNNYLQTSIELKTSVMLKNMMTLLLLSSLWPMLCGLLARLFKNDARLLTQLALCYSFFALFMILGWVGDIISFNTRSRWLSMGFGLITEAGILFVLFWANFYIAFHQSQLRRVVMAGSFTLTVLLFSFLYNNSMMRDFDPQPHYDSTLMAPEFAVAAPVTIAEFVSAGEAVFDRSAAKAGQHKQ